MAQGPDVTGLLIAWSNGEEAAGAPLMEAVHGELRRMAGGFLRRERRHHSLAPTALVHDAYVKLVDQRQVRWKNRAHFLAVAAHVMRRLLVDHARARLAAKRGAGAVLQLDETDVAMAPLDPDVLAIDDALERLAMLDPRQARVVELRFFGGLTVEETATVLRVAPITVKRDWALARTWLFRELRGIAP